MELVKQPNRWSCVGAAFAMALGISMEEVIDLVGHDGSERINDKPEPHCYMGFHPEEFTLLAKIKYGANIVWVQPNPGWADNRLLKSTEKRMSKAISLFPNGVLTGRFSSGTHHAIAWDGKRFFDPAGYTSLTHNFQNLVFFYGITFDPK